MPVPEVKPASPEYSDLARILQAALNAVDSYKSTAEHLSRHGNTVTVGFHAYRVSEVHVLAFGKAAGWMARAVLDRLGDLVAGGVVIVPRGSRYPALNPLEVYEADHPIPTTATLKASIRLLNYAETIPKSSLALVLVSGGGSALFEVPADDINIEDVAAITRELLRRGASIEELNAVRKHISAVKGGQLLKHIMAENVATLVISDVVGDRLDTIASGPTVPDETTFRDAYEVLRKYELWSQLPERVRKWIEAGLRGDVPETPKPGDPIFNRNRVVIVANNLKALRAAAAKAEELGYRPLILTDRLRGEAREAAKPLAAVIESTYYNAEPVKPPAALIAGGETTVTVKGSGVGGRNQELCLALTLAADPGVDYRAACMGTDGIDGNSPAAGAYTSPKLLEEARNLNLDPQKHLEDNDSYTFFKKLGKTIETGYTGTNVNDIIVALVDSPTSSKER